jgi:hypothetical protein
MNVTATMRECLLSRLVTVARSRWLEKKLSLLTEITIFSASSFPQQKTRSLLLRNKDKLSTQILKLQITRLNNLRNWDSSIWSLLSIEMKSLASMFVSESNLSQLVQKTNLSTSGTSKIVVKKLNLISQLKNALLSLSTLQVFTWLLQSELTN